MTWFASSQQPVALVVMLSIAGLATPLAAAEPAPAPATGTLAASVGDAHKVHSLAVSRQAFEDYLRLLRQPGAPAGAGPFSARLQTLASQHAAAPERVQELLDVYGRWHDDGFGTPAAQRPRDLEPRHVTEDYRAAWEVLLLAPLTPEVRFMGEKALITEALAQIGHAESVPMLELAFRSAATAGVDQRPGTLALDRQLRIVEALRLFRSDAGLQALMRSLAETEKPHGSATNQISGKTLRQWAAYYLNDDSDPVHRAQWKTVTGRFPRQGLTESQTRLLDEVSPREPRLGPR